MQSLSLKRFFRQSPSIPQISSTTSFLIVHQSISALPDGRFLDMWVLHVKTDAKPIDVGSHIAICRSSADVSPDKNRIKSIPTAIITGVAYCDAVQVIFHIHLSQNNLPSLLSMPLRATDIGSLRKFWFRTRTLMSPTPPSLSSFQMYRWSEPSSWSGWWRIGRSDQSFQSFIISYRLIHVRHISVDAQNVYSLTCCLISQITHHVHMIQYPSIELPA